MGSNLRRAGLLAIGLVLSGALLAGEASAVSVLCQNKSNQKLKVREDVCKIGKEKHIDIVLGGAAAPDARVDDLAEEVAALAAGLAAASDAALKAQILAEEAGDLARKSREESGEIAEKFDKLADGLDSTADRARANRDALDAIEAARPRIVVIPGTASPEENCDAVRNAFAAISDNSAEIRYVVRLGPGLYQCGTEGIDMKPFVDLEGSGRRTTEVVSSECPQITNHTVTLADESELRDMTVVNECVSGSGGQAAIGGLNLEGTRVTNVDAFSAGRGLVLTQVRQAVIASVEVTAASTAVSVPNSFDTPAALVLENVVARAPQALIVAFEADVLVRDSVLEGLVGGTGGPDSRFDVVSTQVGTASSANTFRCVGAYDLDFQPLDGDCK